MVQMESSVSGPVLSARSVYNLIEGDIKQPMRDIQLPLNETLAKIKNGNGKKAKKALKRLQMKGKNNHVKVKTIQNRMNVEKRKRKKSMMKKTSNGKIQIESNAENCKNSKEISGNKKASMKNKKSSKQIQSDDSSTNINSESNFVENENLDISDESSNNAAYEILAGIERAKCNYLKLNKKTNIVNKNKKVKKTLNNSSEKAIKTTKLKKKAKESDSMPLLLNDDEVQNFHLNSKTAIKKIEKDGLKHKSSTKDLAISKIKKGKVSELIVKKTSQNKTKRSLEELSNENSKIHQAGSSNGSNSVDKTLGKKIKKRKIEIPLKEKKMRPIKASKLSSHLVSSKCNLLTNFLTSDMYEVEDSQLLGENVFTSLISPLTPKDFMNDFWEKHHLLVRADDKNRFQSILSTEDIDNILRTNNLSFSKNIDITSYINGKRKTHNPEGRALASVVWDYYSTGSSIRLLNPQTFSNSVWKLLSSLQEYFNSFCGANVYLTPPGTQGFAPHWDDIEAFILQLEGKKRWRVYKWRSEEETLPRDSSSNFGPEDNLGEQLLDCVLEPGDLLYFPRGYIHQAEALDDAHSLHITISTYQKNSWVDLLEKLLPSALEKASANHMEFRRGLPIDYMYNSGIAFSDKKTKAKQLIKKKVVELVNKMMEDAPIDAAVDQLAKGSVYDSLPPYITESEKQHTVFEGGEKWCGKTEGVVNRKELAPETRIRLLRKGCVRLLVEEDCVMLFHSLENSRQYHEDEPKYMEIAPEMAPGIESLIRSYPKYITVEELPLQSFENKMILATGLWEKGIVISENELEPWPFAYDEEEEEEEEDDDDDDEEEEIEDEESNSEQ